jgi:cytochrome c553
MSADEEVNLIRICMSSKSKMKSFFHWLFIFYTVFVIVVFLLVLITNIIERRAWANDPDLPALVETCGKCHDPSRVRKYAKSPQQWQKTIDRMVPNGDADPATLKRIHSLLVRLRSKGGETVLEKTCARCHPKTTIDPYLGMDFAAVSLLIRQHVKQHNRSIPIWEGKLAIEQVGMLQKMNVHGPFPGNAESQLLFQKSCGICHTTTFLYRTMCRKTVSKSQWKTILDRMRAKTPEHIQPQDLPLLIDQSMRVCAWPLP